MRILVDADACPVRNQIVRIAKLYEIPVIFYCDIAHLIEDDYATTIIVDQGKDSADLKLANALVRGDIVVTQDYGLATMALAKGAKVLNASGGEYTNENIDRLLFERHISKKARNAGIRTKGPSKRTPLEDEKFELLLKQFVDINYE